MNRTPYESLSPEEKYVVLALAADDLVIDASVVFIYFGPPRLRRYARRWVDEGLEAIICELIELEAWGIDAVENTPPVFRRQYLRSQIRSLTALLEIGQLKLVGAPLSDAVTRVLGLVPPPPYDLRKIRTEETALIRSQGYESYADFQMRRKQEALFDISNARLRRWVRELMDSFVRDIAPHMLHGDELADVAIRSRVRIAEPEKGYPPDYYIYHGRRRGTMCLGSDYRKTRLAAMRTIMHEICPGHHMYYLYRELLCELGLLGIESTVDLLYSSETPISEGVAETGLFYLSSLDRDILGQARTATAREHFCKKVLYNVWYHRYIEERMTDDEARRYLVDEGGFESKKVGIWLSFIDGWRIYYPAYPVGTDRIKAGLTGDAARDLMYLYLPKSLAMLEEKVPRQEKATGAMPGLGISTLPPPCRRHYRQRKERTT